MPSTKDSDLKADLAPRKGMSVEDIQHSISIFLESATLTEKISLMSGSGFLSAMIEDGMRPGLRPYAAGGKCERFEIPGFFFTDGPRGVVRGEGTCFPVTMARGASWDRGLERRIGEAMAVEARAGGCNLSGAVCVNLLRHPAWGRAQETYGEDSFHLGEMGAALSEGLQTHNVVAAVKHFALNSMENARFSVNVICSERTLREVYLPHFKRIIDSGCASVMSAYNKLNGEYCGQSRVLLTDILRSEWGFDGFVHSDWLLGVYNVYGATAGLDIEMPEPLVFGSKLKTAVLEGDIEPATIDTACRRILSVLYRFACAEDPYPEYTTAMVACDAHTRLAQEAAEKSAVLLRNTGLLPLSREVNVGIFGHLAAVQNTGDHGSSSVFPPYVVTPLEGLSTYLGRDLSVLGDEQDPEAAALRAADLDAAIIIVGLTAEEEGEFIPGDTGVDASAQLLKDADPEIIQRIEAAKAKASQNPPKHAKDTGALGAGQSRGGDRDHLRLPPAQVALIQEISKTNPNTVIVVIAGSAIISVEWADNVAAILQTFYSGMEGGHALARLLYGEVTPSGKLPFSVAKDEDDYPFFDKHADEIEYGPLHGYRLLRAKDREPQFPFGFGLSYTEFEYRALKLLKKETEIEAQICVKNVGAVKGDEIVQLYVDYPNKVVERTSHQLKGFERVELAPGEQKAVKITIPIDDLKYWNVETNDWVIEQGEHRIFVGGSSDTRGCRAISVTL